MFNLSFCCKENKNLSKKIKLYARGVNKIYVKTTHTDGKQIFQATKVCGKKYCRE